jgi:hypothetical protein
MPLATKLQRSGITLKVQWQPVRCPECGLTVACLDPRARLVYGVRAVPFGGDPVFLAVTSWRAPRIRRGPFGVPVIDFPPDRTTPTRQPLAPAPNIEVELHHCGHVWKKSGRAIARAHYQGKPLLS